MVPWEDPEPRRKPFDGVKKFPALQYVALGGCGGQRRIGKWARHVTGERRRILGGCPLPTLVEKGG
jgi:hypothetical protein